VNEKILITGATGLLGKDLVNSLKRNYRPLGVSSAEFDIRNHDKVLEFFRQMKPDIVLHAAAMVDVDRCETEREEATAVNVDGTENIALACKDIGARMIYYSTDYVFDGTKNDLYTETDKTNPINHYGQTKLEGEKRILDIVKDGTVIRISWLFGTCRENFVTRTLKSGLEYVRNVNAGKPAEPVKVVSDQKSTPTWTVDIADQTAKIIEKNITGIVHAASDGVASRYDLAENIFEDISFDVELVPEKSESYNFTAPRPKYTPLANNRLTELGICIMRPYQEAIREFLTVYDGKI
jgi:dTDP-4-dehydrorhamnose reductase